MAKVRYDEGEREASAKSPGETKRDKVAAKIVITLSNFEVGKEKLKPEHERALADAVTEFRLGQTCSRGGSVALIEGYTDAVDSEATNAALRDLRVSSAERYLFRLISPGHFDHADTSRAAPAGQYLNPRNDTPQARADNRAVKIELALVPLDFYFQVRTHPISFDTDTCGVVSVEPWERIIFWVGDVYVKGRGLWASRPLPLWEKEVVYYNTNLQPLARFLDKIVIHHTSNNESLDKNERNEQERGFAAIGYHFAIDQNGDVYQCRPLEVMGSHAGEGVKPGPMNDPDWGAVGIVLLADFESDKTNLWSPDKPSAKMLESLKNLIKTLQRDYAINQLLMHKEVTRKGAVTVCPGKNMYKHVEAIRTELGMSGKDTQ